MNIEEILRAGRRLPWTSHVLAALVLVAHAVTMLVLLDRGMLPDPLPVHWGADGSPDRFVPLTAGAVLTLPLVLGLTLLLLTGIAAALPALMRMQSSWPPSGPDTSGPSPWERLRREGAERGIRSVLGWTMVAIVLPLSWPGPYLDGADSSVGPMLLTLVVLLLPAFVLPMLHWRRWARRTAALHGLAPSGDEAAEDARWTAGDLFLNDPGNPNLWVPSRDSETKFTVNLGHPRGRLVATLMVLGLVAVLALPVVLISLVGS